MAVAKPDKMTHVKEFVDMLISYNSVSEKSIIKGILNFFKEQNDVYIVKYNMFSGTVNYSDLVTNTPPLKFLGSASGDKIVKYLSLYGLNDQEKKDPKKNYKFKLLQDDANKKTDKMLQFVISASKTGSRDNSIREFQNYFDELGDNPPEEVRYDKYIKYKIVLNDKIKNFKPTPVFYLNYFTIAMFMAWNSIDNDNFTFFMYLLRTLYFTYPFLINKEELSQMKIFWNFCKNKAYAENDNAKLFISFYSSIFKV